MKFLSFVLLLCISCLSQAGALYDESHPWSGYQNIVELGFSNDLAMVKVDGDLLNPASCPKTDFYVTGWTMGSAEAQGMYTILTIAYSSKQPVNFQIWNGCHSGRPVVVSVWTKN